MCLLRAVSSGYHTLILLQPPTATLLIANSKHAILCMLPVRTSLTVMSLNCLKAIIQSFTLPGEFAL